MCLFRIRETVIKRVCDGKVKEIRLGLDGFMVHDLGLVPHINAVIFIKLRLSLTEVKISLLVVERTLSR